MRIAPHFPQQVKDILIRSPLPNGFDDGHAPLSGRNIQVPMFHGIRFLSYYPRIFVKACSNFRWRSMLRLTASLSRIATSPLESAAAFSAQSL